MKKNKIKIIALFSILLICITTFTFLNFTSTTTGLRELYPSDTEFLRDYTFEEGREELKVEILYPRHGGSFDLLNSLRVEFRVKNFQLGEEYGVKINGCKVRSIGPYYDREDKIITRSIKLSEEDVNDYAPCLINWGQYMSRIDYAFFPVQVDVFKNDSPGDIKQIYRDRVTSFDFRGYFQAIEDLGPTLELSTAPEALSHLDMSITNKSFDQFTPLILEKFSKGQGLGKINTKKYKAEKCVRVLRLNTRIQTKYAFDIFKATKRAIALGTTPPKISICTKNVKGLLRNLKFNEKMSDGDLNIDWQWRVGMDGERRLKKKRGLSLENFSGNIEGRIITTYGMRVKWETWSKPIPSVPPIPSIPISGGWGISPYKCNGDVSLGAAQSNASPRGEKKDDSRAFFNALYSKSKDFVFFSQHWPLILQVLDIDTNFNSSACNSKLFRKANSRLRRKAKKQISIKISEKLENSRVISDAITDFFKNFSLSQLVDTSEYLNITQNINDLRIFIDESAFEKNHMDLSFKHESNVKESKKIKYPYTKLKTPTLNFRNHNFTESQKVLLGDERDYSFMVGFTPNIFNDQLKKMSNSTLFNTDIAPTYMELLGYCPKYVSDDECFREINDRDLGTALANSIPNADELRDIDKLRIKIYPTLAPVLTLAYENAMDMKPDSFHPTFKQLFYSLGNLIIEVYNPDNGEYVMKMAVDIFLNPIDLYNGDSDNDFNLNFGSDNIRITLLDHKLRYQPFEITTNDKTLEIDFVDYTFRSFVHQQITKRLHMALKEQGVPEFYNGEKSIFSSIPVKHPDRDTPQLYVGPWMSTMINLLKPMP